MKIYHLTQKNFRSIDDWDYSVVEDSINYYANLEDAQKELSKMLEEQVDECTRFNESLVKRGKPAAYSEETLATMRENKQILSEGIDGEYKNEYPIFDIKIINVL